MGWGQYTMVGGQNTMGRGLIFPWVRGSKYHALGGRYTMDRGKSTMGREVNIPWIGGQNTMGR